MADDIEIGENLVVRFVDDVMWLFGADLDHAVRLKLETAERLAEVIVEAACKRGSGK